MFFQLAVGEIPTRTLAPFGPVDWEWKRVDINGFIGRVVHKGAPRPGEWVQAEIRNATKGSCGVLWISAKVPQTGWLMIRWALLGRDTAAALMAKVGFADSVPFSKVLVALS